MAINIVSNSGKTSYNIKEYVADTFGDLPVDEHAGSTAYVIDEATNYMYNSKGEWVPVTLGQGGGGGGTGDVTKAYVDARDNAVKNELGAAISSTATSLGQSIGNVASMAAAKQDPIIAGSGIEIAEDGKTISALGGKEELFICYRDETPITDIIAAYKAGKTIICNYSAGGEDSPYYAALQSAQIQSDTKANFCFSSVIKSSVNMIYANNIDKSRDTWTDEIVPLQPGLVSGINIKTINGQNILGEGDLPVSGGGASDCGVKYDEVKDALYSVNADQEAIGRGIAIGNGAKTVGGISLGRGADSKAGALAIGTSAAERNAIAIGNINTASAQYTVAIGNTNYAEAENAIVIGKSSSANSQNSIIMGLNNKTNFDENLNIDSQNSVLIGNNLETDYANQTIFGKYNENIEDSIFVIADGEVDEEGRIMRHNAMWIDKEGTSHFNGTDLYFRGGKVPVQAELVAGEGIKITRRGIDDKPIISLDLGNAEDISV